MCEKFILQIYKFKNKLLTWELHCKWAQLFFFFVNTVVHCKYTQLFFEYTGSWRRLSPEQCLEGSRFCSLFIYWQAMAHLHSSPWTHKAGVVLMSCAIEKLIQLFREHLSVDRCLPKIPLHSYTDRAQESDWAQKTKPGFSNSTFDHSCICRLLSQYNIKTSIHIKFKFLYY